MLSVNTFLYTWKATHAWKYIVTMTMTSVTSVKMDLSQLQNFSVTFNLVIASAWNYRSDIWNRADPFLSDKIIFVMLQLLIGRYCPYNSILTTEWSTWLFMYKRLITVRFVHIRSMSINTLVSLTSVCST